MTVINTRSAILGSEWTIFSAPAAATRATATIAAAGAGVRRVLTGFMITLSPVAAQPNGEFQIRDGATGAGTVLWQGNLIAPIAAGSIIFGLSDLFIVGSANTAMTIEFVAAPAATNFQRVNAAGVNTL